MTQYAVGDIQGCLDPLLQLLERLRFEPSRDQLISVGDLINRGPKSLETLRFCYQLGDSFKMVLGNHDLHLLAVARGVRPPTKKDTLDEILAAPDADELLNWLQQQPLMLRSGDYNIVHAGIPPMWDVLKAKALADEVGAVLQSERSGDYFSAMYGNQPAIWSEDLEGPVRWRVITNYLTRMRFCSPEGELELERKDAENAPAPFEPWFEHSHRPTRHNKIIFGHWASLEGRDCGDNLYPLDTGYVWGGSLRIMRLEDGQYFHQQADK
jgi:bis(5'-nucleosyl)-tetraphosphatase (symmetrical)